MIRTSEWVSIGHPDKTADFITSYILDRYLENDPNVRYALEVMIKGNQVILAGEITSTYYVPEERYVHFVKDALRQIGYNEDYAGKWGDNAIDINKVTVETIVSQQSMDISKGVERNGWGDQGIYVGYACGDSLSEYLPIDYILARGLGMHLYIKARFGYDTMDGGIDIKTQITYDYDANKVTQAIVAIPTLTPEEYNNVVADIYNWFNQAKVGVPIENIIINGTGSYTTHSSIGDCGVTGRKLVVDLYGGNCNIGGGSLWGKDPTKSDVTLNIYMRHKAIERLEELKEDGQKFGLSESQCSAIEAVKASTSTCIGKNEFNIQYEYFDKNGSIIAVDYEPSTYANPKGVSIEGLIETLKLRAPIYEKLCKNGLSTLNRY